MPLLGQAIQALSELFAPKLYQARIKLDILSILLLSPNPTRKALPDLQLWASLQPSREYDFLFNFCNCALYNCDLFFLLSK